jgi:Domain of unknown function (DUF6265)
MVMRGVRLRGGIRWLGGGVVAMALIAMPCVISASRHQAAAAGAASVTIDRLSWMVGDWTGTMGKASIEEHWIPAAGKTMLAVARTVVGERTVAFEFLRIEQRPDGLVYVAQPGGRPPTEFRLTSAEGQSATFENPQHDNPKIIRYRKDGEATLVAEIEGDEKGKPVTMRFVFTRVAARP